MRLLLPLLHRTVMCLPLQPEEEMKRKSPHRPFGISTAFRQFVSFSKIQTPPQDFAHCSLTILPGCDTQMELIQTHSNAQTQEHVSDLLVSASQLAADSASARFGCQKEKKTKTSVTIHTSGHLEMVLV